MGFTTKEKIIEIIDFYLEHDEPSTLSTFNITSETLNRYKRTYKQHVGDFDLKNNFKKIKEKYTAKEIASIASGGRVIPAQDKIPIIDFSGTRIKIGICSDTHIGNKCFKEDVFYKMLEVYKKERVECILHAGDVTDGMSPRQGHVNELTHIGVDCQQDYSIKLLKEIKKPLYVISGNHDYWAFQANGVDVVKNICDHISNATYLGNDHGILSLKKATIWLRHGSKGSAYSISYRPQKMVEAITGGEKPNLLIVGHYHKMLQMFERNIHVYMAGAVSTQSDFMKKNDLANHTGFWIVTLTINSKGQITKNQGEWFPFYQ